MLGENGRWGRLCAAGLGCVLWGLLAAPVSAEVSVSGDVLPNTDPLTWDTSTYLYVGNTDSGELVITDASVINDAHGRIGYQAGSTGTVVVDGAGSAWLNSGGLWVGDLGNGTLNITNGGYVSNKASLGGLIGANSGSSGVVTVDGIGSTWNSSHILVGGAGSGTLNITHGGLVRTSSLTIDFDEDGDSCIKMANGSMLALRGEADALLADFLGLIYSNADIRYWNGSAWANLMEATYGVDYTLEYFAEGDLAGYTKLTVMAVPEPATLSLLGLGAMALLRRKHN